MLSVVSRVTLGPRFTELVCVVQQTFCDCQQFEMFAVLGCYAIQIGGYLPTFRDLLSFMLIKVKHSRNVDNYQTTLRNISEDRRPRAKA